MTTTNLISKIGNTPLIYFLNDLSITIGKSGIISVDFSVWIPIFLINLINLIGITQVNAK